jgi:hypothetical protein
MFSSICYFELISYKSDLSLESMAQHSPKAKIFCLIHKMDLVPENQREAVRSFEQTFL